MNVVVSTHTVAMDAHIVKGRLEAEGIPATLEDDQYITMDWFLSSALGGVKVSVPEAFVDDAIKILELTDNDEYQISKLDSEALPEAVAADFIPEVPMRCPKCDSYKISKLEWMRNLSLVVLYFFHSPLAFSQRYYSCDDCGHVFRSDKGVFSSASRSIVFVLSLLLAMFMVFVLFFSGSNYSNYLTRSNGSDMIFYSDEPPADWDEAEQYEYENPYEGVPREELPKPDGAY